MKFNSDVVIRLGSLRGNDEQARLERVLRDQPGVRDVQASSRAQRLFVVSFDAEAISALGILRCLRAQGFAASLIGM